MLSCYHLRMQVLICIPITKQEALILKQQSRHSNRAVISDIQTDATSPQGKLEKWYATTKTLPIAIGTTNLDLNLGSNGQTRAVYSVVEEQQKQVVETPPPQRLGRMDRGLIALTLCLLAIGILMVYSASHLLSSRHYDGYSYRYLQIHIVACAIGLVGMFFTSHLPYRFYARFANLFLILSFIGLLLVFVPGLGASVQGAEGGRFRRWIRIANLPIHFQPMEFAKIALVIHVANFISRNPERVKSFFNGVLPNILIVGAAFGLVYIQPDFGSAALLVVTICIVLFVGGMRLWHVLTLGGVGAGLFSLLIIRDSYKLKRLMDYLAMFEIS